MRIEPGTPRREQEEAFNHRDVRDIVDQVAAQDFDARLLAVARQSVISATPAPREALRAELQVADGEPILAAAVAIADAGARIAREHDPELQGRRMGAVFERLIWAMCSARKPAETTRETHVALVANKHVADPRTGRMDVVVDAVPFEAYECKFGSKIEQSDIDDLGAIFVTARAEGVDSRPSVATWGTRWQLDAQIKRAGIVLDEVLYYADEDELSRNVVRDRPPSARLR